MVSTSKYTADGAQGAIHVIKDITEAKAADERFTSLFNHMHEGVFASTPEGKILDCNDAFVRMLGYDSKEEMLAGQTQSVYVDQEDRDNFLNEMSRQGFVRNFEYPVAAQRWKRNPVIESSFATRDPAAGSNAIRVL